jgi:hypothetical protein
MMYIPFPRTDLDNDTDLVAWRTKTSYKESDWKKLKDFLAKQPRLFADIHPLPKCWYSELHQGDNYALDVEHFRPKKSGNPLTAKQKTVIGKRFGLTVEQLEDKAISPYYHWLKFDYRNYRLVTALTNRTGAKHIYFPVAKNSKRLASGEFPWYKKEYPLLLDPTNEHDANLLLVQPNGAITPRATKTLILASDYADLAKNWHNEGFNYLRASITIHLYRLNERVFIEGRHKVYQDTIKNIGRLLRFHKNNDMESVKDFTEELLHSILPSAQFALAAKCAMQAYVVPSMETHDTIQDTENSIKAILQAQAQLIKNEVISWKKP